MLGAGADSWASVGPGLGAGWFQGTMTGAPGGWPLRETVRRAPGWSRSPAGGSVLGIDAAKDRKALPRPTPSSGHRGLRCAEANTWDRWRQWLCWAAHRLGTPPQSATPSPRTQVLLLTPACPLCPCQADVERALHVGTNRKASLSGSARWARSPGSFVCGSQAVGGVGGGGWGHSWAGGHRLCLPGISSDMGGGEERLLHEWPSAPSSRLTERWGALGDEGGPYRAVPRAYRHSLGAPWSGRPPLGAPAPSESP